MTLLVAILLAVLFAGCATPPVSAVNTQPESLFEAHVRLCPQCSKPLLSPDGTENSLCEEGFRAFQEDVRRAQANQTTNTGQR
jgi:hypothetical protein